MSNNSTGDLVKPIYKNGRYDNPFPNWRLPSYWNTMKWLLMTKDNSNIPRKQVLDKSLPIMIPDRRELSKPPEAGSIRYVWLGHATTLVQFDGVTILTDPMFSERCSMVQFVGPKRFRAAPLGVAGLPHVDAVLISHNHYDHLDYGTVVKLRRRFGKAVTWYVPLGNARWMREVGGCEVVKEMTWWESATLRGHPSVRVVCTPTQHWSGRGLNDTNTALWSSWSVLGPTHSYFFTGDTGYCDVFKQIGQQYGPFSLAAIPIGSYQPRWFMSPQHIDPAQAVIVHKDLQSKKSFAIHWGTFKMASEFYMEPKQKLESELKSQNVPDSEFITVKHGQINYVTFQEP